MEDEALRAQPAEDLPEELRALFGRTSLPDEALAEIGRAVAHFAILEHTLVSFIQGLLGGHECKRGERVVRILTSERSFRGLMDLSASLVRELRGDTIAEAYKPVLKSMAAAESERNTLSHSLWAMSFGSSEPRLFVRTKYTAKQRKGLDFRREEIDMHNLRRNADKPALATFALRSFASRFVIFTDY